MRVGDKLWMNWNEHPMQLWQIQLNFAVWCASSACRVSSQASARSSIVGNTASALTAQSAF